MTQQPLPLGDPRAAVPTDQAVRRSISPADLKRFNASRPPDRMVQLRALSSPGVRHDAETVDLARWLGLPAVRRGRWILRPEPRPEWPRREG